jgi:hypothetical protein
MKKSFMLKLFVSAFIVLMLVGVIAQPALAKEATFNLSLYHGINGKRIGLSEDLPVDVYIYRDGFIYAYVLSFTYMDRYDAQFPPGRYLIKFYSQELGKFVDSMTVGPVDISEGAEFRMNAQLGVGEEPVVKAKVDGSNLPERGTGYYQGFAKVKIADEDTFAFTVYHGIDGKKLGLSENLPVDISVFRNDELVSYIPNLTFMERVDLSFLPGRYLFKVYVRELGVFVDSLTLGPVDVSEGDIVNMNLQFGKGEEPVSKSKKNSKNLPERGTGYYQGYSKTVVTGEDEFDLSVYHGVDGRELDLSEALPVDVHIYRNGDVVGYIPNFTRGERYSDKLPVGTYTFKVYSHELGKFIDSMTVSSLDLSEGVGLRLSFQLGPSTTPTTVVNYK